MPLIFSMMAVLMASTLLDALILGSLRFFGPLQPSDMLISLIFCPKSAAPGFDAAVFQGHWRQRLLPVGTWIVTNFVSMNFVVVLVLGPFV